MTFAGFTRTVLPILAMAAIAVFTTGCKEKIRHHHPEPQPCPPSPAWTEITGRLLIDGKACDDGKVTVFWGKGRCYKQACETDKKGYFSMGNIPARREVAIEFRGKRHKREYIATRSMWSGRPCECIQLGAVDLKEFNPQPQPRPMPGPVPGPHPGPRPHPGPVEKCDIKLGGCVQFDGKDAKDAVVRVVAGNIYERTVTTDHKGRFKVTDVPRHARVEIFVEQKIHHAKLIGSAVVKTGKDNMDVGVITLIKKKK